MKAVLGRLERGELNTDLSVAAVSGLDGAIEGIQAVAENRLPGKIVVYPSCREPRAHAPRSRRAVERGP